MLDPEVMPAWGQCTVLMSAVLVFILLNSERAVIALGPSSAAELVVGVTSFALGSCLF